MSFCGTFKICLFVVRLRYTLFFAHFVGVGACCASTAELFAPLGQINRFFSKKCRDTTSEGVRGTLASPLGRANTIHNRLS